ncbi:MAG TPA: flagellin [Candidatus Saccharimonadales bacterium]|nr:flagellin [Candidatus Saccharimonadales bacterium]
MSLGVLNNVASLSAQNQLSMTNASLQKTLYRLSSGSKLNSGADDAAGLSIANGLSANISALTQSASNATNGVGKLQVADGSLSQITALLNRAVTLATESANGTVTAGQRTALDTEFKSIKNEIDNIGSQTTYNGSAVFAGTSTNYAQVSFTPDNASGLATAIASGQILLKWGVGGASTFASSATDKTVGDLINDVNTNSNGALVASLDGSGNLVITNTDGTAASATTNLQDNVSTLKLGADAGAETASQTSNSSTFAVYLSDATSTGSGTISVNLNTLSSSGLNGASLASNDLTSAANAQAALTSINTAIAQVAALRGNIGASINQLSAAVNVENNQIQNLTSAQDNISSADISTEVSNMTKYNVLTQTGISALSQSNQMQQALLKLLQ